MLTHDFTSGIFNDNNKLISKKMDSNRNCLRHMNHTETEFSSQSIMKAMEKFVQAVQEMDETILVPCRLLDLQVGDTTDTVGFKSSSNKRVDRDGPNSTDLHSLYALVNLVKTELLWGANEQPQEEETHTHVTSPAIKTHTRRPSTASMASTNSAVSTISDTDSEAGIENDSGIEGETETTTKPSYTQKVEESFRQHLYGLHRSLEQMTEAASYLTKRYQNEIGGAV